jgi:signal transduction histidine kinase
MRRRLGIALIGMVITSLVLAGLGTIVLASVTNRQTDEQELRDQTDALRALFSEVTVIGSADGGETRAERLQRLSRSMSLDGIGIIVIPSNGAAPIGSLPSGVTIDDIDLEKIREGEIVSGVKDGLIFAAGGTDNRVAGSTLLVLTRDPDPIVAPAFRWFLVAGFGTVLVAILVTVRLSRRLTEPIRQASATASEISAGNLAARVDDAHTSLGGELADLVESINTMAATLERSRALERQFLLSVSHDLRTPLTNIRGYAEALVDGAVDDPVAAGSVIESESRRLERLVGDLLLLARLEGTGFAYSMRAQDLSLIIENTIDGLRHEAADRNVELTVRLPAGAVNALIDRDRFEQVVANLVGNALKFADSSVAVTMWFAEGRIHLSVADDGPGISDADLPHVFERLYVAQHNPKISESGSGLGLAIVRELIEGMDGTVMARRSPAGGAEFVVSLRPAPT